MRGHRSAAQKGQNSEPTNSTSGFPPGTQWWLSGAGRSARSAVVPATVAPTESNDAGGTLARVGDDRRRGARRLGHADGRRRWVRA